MPFDQTKLNDLLKKCCVKANICDEEESKRFTSHTFRRGGSQHKFMYAKKLMSLHAIKYWAGWSDKDSNETLLKYLLDDKFIQENDFGNFYNPDVNHKYGITEESFVDTG